MDLEAEAEVSESRDYVLLTNYYLIFLIKWHYPYFLKGLNDCF